MNKVDIYYDHYKESFSLSQNAQKRRNKFFVILCILEALSFLFLIKPNEVIALFNASVCSKLDIMITFGMGVFQTLLWILIAYTLVRYCQDMLYIERLYPYLDILEKKVASELGEPIFSREGDRYQENYPMILNFIDLFYKMFSPILFSLINIVCIRTEWKNKIGINLALVCDTVIFATIMIITWFFFFEIHSKITEWFKTHVPFIGWGAKILRKILKEV